MNKQKIKFILSLIVAIIFFLLYIYDRYDGFLIIGTIWLFVAGVYFIRRNEKIK